MLLGGAVTGADVVLRVGALVGLGLGNPVGPGVGDGVGSRDGKGVGCKEGLDEGIAVGPTDGIEDGLLLGLREVRRFGPFAGASAVGYVTGALVGASVVGCTTRVLDGDSLGNKEGATLGASVGLVDLTPTITITLYGRSRRSLVTNGEFEKTPVINAMNSNVVISPLRSKSRLAIARKHDVPASSSHSVLALACTVTIPPAITYLVLTSCRFPFPTSSGQPASAGTRYC
mmetsp:Transcript_29937/g.71922  ORF Transcript_29937/g.71922 Transcript_29937/m.71922 type:complete len:230 (+) Transcript_29937:320-1009(+)